MHLIIRLLSKVSLSVPALVFSFAALGARADIEVTTLISASTDLESMPGVRLINPQALSVGPDGSVLPGGS
jgi:hypothetical protein